MLIKFGFALENKNLAECIQILEEKFSQENEGHWKTLLRISLEEQNYFIVERCYAALGEIPKARYIRKINKIVRGLIKEGQSRQSAMGNYQVQALLAILNKQFAKAESIYLEKEEIDKAIQLYQEIHKWEESLRIAEKLRPEEYQELKEKYFNWLLQTNQQEKAAEILEKEGNN